LPSLQAVLCIGSLCLVVSAFILFILAKAIKLFPSLQAVLRVWKPLPCSLLHSLCFDSTNQILLFSAGGSVYLEAFALFSTPILFVLTQQIKLFPSLQAVLCIWKPLPCSLPPFSLF
jgi:hypothetical protein